MPVLSSIHIYVLQYFRFQSSLLSSSWKQFFSISDRIERYEIIASHAWMRMCHHRLTTSFDEFSAHNADYHPLSVKVAMVIRVLSNAHDCHMRSPPIRNPICVICFAQIEDRKRLTDKKRRRSSTFMLYKCNNQAIKFFSKILSAIR